MKKYIGLTILLLTFIFLYINNSSYPIAESSSADVSTPKETSQFIPLDVTITAYSPDPAQTSGISPFQMASGRYAKTTDLYQLRFVAISRDLKKKYNLEWGDKIYIEFEVQDTMNKRIKNTIDIFFRNKDLARRFGKQERRIIILGEKK